MVFFLEQNLIQNDNALKDLKKVNDNWIAFFVMLKAYSISVN